MAFPFRTPKKFYCVDCGWNDSTPQYGDLLNPPTFDMLCPKCRGELRLKDISTLEQIINRFTGR